MASSPSGLPSRSYTAHASSAMVSARGSALPMSSLAMRRRGARCTADRSRRPASGTANTGRHPDRCRAPICAGPKSDRRNSRRPCRNAHRCCRSRRAWCRHRAGGPPPPAELKSAAVSSKLSMRRASPSAAASNSSRAPASICSFSCPKPRSWSASARSSSLPKISGIERFQHIDPRPRQQCVVDLEGRVFGGRADENQRAILDVGQKGVLLRLVEAMHFIEKQHRVAGAAQDCAPARRPRGCP